MLFDKTWRSGCGAMNYCEYYICALRLVVTFALLSNSHCDY